MAEGLILEFDELGRERYAAVSQRLGIDMAAGTGDWPAGLLFHAGGEKAGGFVVFEVWASRADQDRFMSERLGRALQESGVTSPPVRMEWLDIAAHWSPGG